MSDEMPVAQTIGAKSTPEIQDSPQSAGGLHQFANDRAIVQPESLPEWRLTLCVGAAVCALVFLTALVAGVLAGGLYIALHSVVANGEAPGLVPILIGASGLLFAILILLPMLLAKRAEAEAGVVAVEHNTRLMNFVRDVAGRLAVNPPSALGISQRPVVRLYQGLPALNPDSRSTELVIGLPLLRSLSVAELGGLVAHELGHFASPQGRSKRFMTLSINRWLQQTANCTDAALHLRPGAYLVSLVAALIAKISKSILREIEIHGDWYQVQIAGSESFKKLAENAHLAVRSYESVRDELADEENSEYPADVSHLVIERTHQKSVDDQRYLREVMLESPGCLQGDHPPGYDRLDDAENFGDIAGDLLAAHSAIDLVDEPVQLARQVSLAWFREVLNIQIDDESLLSETAIVRKLEAHRELNQVLDNYFLGFFHRTRFLPAGDINAALKIPAEQRLAQIEKACEEVRRISPEARRALGEYDDSIGEILDDARAAVRAEVDGKEHDTETNRRAQRAFKDANSELADLEQRFSDRMALGLAGALADAVLDNPQVAKIMREEIGKLLALQNAFSGCRDTLIELRVQIVRADMANKLKAKDLAHSCHQTIARLVGNISARFEKSPSVDPTDKRSMIPAINAEVDAASDGSVVSTGREFVRAIERHYLRLLVRLSEIALETEARHGIKLKLID